MAIKKPIHKLLFLLLLGAVLWFAHKPVWNGFREWRAGRLLEQSREFTAEGNWAEAKRTAAASYQLSQSIEAFRLVFESFYRDRDPSAFQIGASLFHHPEATNNDRVRVLEVFIDSGDLATAGTLLQALGEAAESEPALAFQRIRYHLATKQWPEALALAKRQADGERATEIDLLLAKHLSESGQDEFQNDVAARLEALLGNEDRLVALRAMRQLAATPRPWISDRLLAKVLRRFRDDADLNVGEDLAFAFLRICEIPADLETVVDAMIAKYQVDHLPELVEWLDHLEEWEQLVAVTEERELDANTFKLRLASLQHLGRYEDLRAALADPAASIPGPLLLATRAAVETKLNNEARAVALWRQAFEAADVERSENHFYRLALIARETGAPEREMEALARAIEHPLGVPPPAERLAPLFFWLHRTDAHDRLLNISYKLIQREPGNAVLINNYHYLRCLKDQSAENAVEIMSAIVESFPDQPAYRSSLAFALIREGRTEEALAVLDQLGPDPAAFDQSEKTIYAIVLAALDRLDEAKALADTIEWKRFSREEAKILQQMVRGN